MSYTWEELREEYSTENYPPFGGPFTDALDPWEWLSKNFDPPKRTEKNSNSNGRWNGWIDLDRIEEMKRVDNKEVNQPDKIKVKVEKDSEVAKMVDTMKADKQDFKNRVESGEFSGSYMKQTAVKWLINQVEDNMGDIPPEIKEQVKQMFKDQIMEAYMKAKLEHIDTLGLDVVKNKIINDTEQYYNETYLSDNTNSQNKK